MAQVCVLRNDLRPPYKPEGQRQGLSSTSGTLCKSDRFNPRFSIRLAAPVAFLLHVRW